MKEIIDYPNITETDLEILGVDRLPETPDERLAFANSLEDAIERGVEIKNLTPKYISQEAMLGLRHKQRALASGALNAGNVAIRSSWI